MNLRPAALALCLPAAALLQAGCAELNTKTGSTALGAAIGCVAGAATAKLTKNDAALGCAAGAVVGGAVGYMRARNLEVEEAKTATNQVAADVPGAKATPVQTQSIQVLDKQTKKTETVQAFRTVSVDIPLNQLDTNEGKAAMRKLEAYAAKTADTRADTIEFQVANPPARGARAVKVTQKESIEVAGKGKVKRVEVIDPQVPAGFQRVTIEAKNQSHIEV
ncbi:glycine zipper domain-containing protein [Viridibacterium curvum]|uniref:Glycine zipper domain-containing protein n=1 Tax=Viridibacterium curvum TaxID=1101404 RepID=A0ABP9QAX4_9RHOO